MPGLGVYPPPSPFSITGSSCVNVSGVSIVHVANRIHTRYHRIYLSSYVLKLSTSWQLAVICDTMLSMRIYINIFPMQMFQDVKRKYKMAKNSKTGHLV